MIETIQGSRRSLLGVAGKGLLSAGAIGVLAANPAMAAMKGAMSASQGDIDILNTALGLELEAIEAYQIGAESGLLAKPVLDVAVLFQGHHKGHRDALIGAIHQLGGTPVAAKSRADYVAALNIASVKSATDVLRLAQRLERGAANAYIGVIPSFKNHDFAQTCAKLAADEASHWTALCSALGDSLPTAAFLCGCRASRVPAALPIGRKAAATARWGRTT
jgi:rubrerythrin